MGKATGVLTGTALVEQKADGRRRLEQSSTTMVALAGTVASQTTDSDGTILYSVVDNSGRGGTLVIVAADNSSVKLASSVAPIGNSSRRLTALSADESREHRRLGEERRRLFADVAGDAALERDSDNVLDPTGLCLVYHCFAGDVGCDEPATRDMCAEWSEDGR